MRPLFCTHGNRPVTHAKVPPPNILAGSPSFLNVVRSLADEHQLVVLTYRNRSASTVGSVHGGTVYRILLRFDRLLYPYNSIIESVFSFLLISIIVRYEDIDIIHSHSTAYPTPGISAVSAVQLVPIIYNCQDEQFSERVVRLGNTVHWFSGSSPVDSLLENAGVPADQIIRIRLRRQHT